MGKTKTQIARLPSKSTPSTTGDKLNPAPEQVSGPQQAHKTTAAFVSRKPLSSSDNVVSLMRLPMENASGHERAHLSTAIQRQTGNNRLLQMLAGPQAKISVSTPSDREEQEADKAASGVISGQVIAPIMRLAGDVEPLLQAQFGHVPATPGWSARVQQAKRDHTELDLLNYIFTSLYPDVAQRFRELSLPVSSRTSGQEVDGGVYYDASLTDDGMTSQRTVTTGGSCSGCSCTPEQTETYIFILLGPSALSEGTPKYSENVLYHEYVHYLQRKGRMHSRLLAGSSAVRLRIHREALAHAESFRHYFGQLYWQGSSTMPGSRRAAEAIRSLELINRHYYEQSEAPVRTEVLQLITSVIQAPQRNEKRDFLLELIGRLSVSGWTGRSEFGNDLRQTIAGSP